MPKRSSKPTLDLNQLAAGIVAKETGTAPPEKTLPKKKNPAAVALGRLGGLKGGKARAVKLSARRRQKIARDAAKTRWGKRTA